MQNIKFLALAFIALILFFNSCAEDSIEINEGPLTPTPVLGIVSGTAFFDSDADGIGDIPMNDATVYLGDSLILSAADWEYDPSDPSVKSKSVDPEGVYSFQGVSPFGNQVVKIIPNMSYTSIIGLDNTPDGDINETLDNELIQVSLDPLEIDNGNDFVVQLTDPSISGYVLLDVDGDSIADQGAADHRMELYNRAENGVANGTAIAVAYTDADGYYEFREIPIGEYVIHHIGAPFYPYNCVSYMDESPEDGEPPLTPYCIFIPVNLETDDAADDGNVYVISITEHELTGYIVGVIEEDITRDGFPDEATDLQIMVELYERDANGLATGDVLYSTLSDTDGTYRIEDIEPGNYVLTLNESSADFTILYGTATTPPYPSPFIASVDMSAGQGVNSYFWISTDSNIDCIKGSVYKDEDGDGIGDAPELNHTVVELYLRGADDLPMGDLLYKTQPIGEFYFTNLSTGNYILKLTETDGYNCISSEDSSPEAGEPTSPACEYILVDFVEGSLDSDNHYVIEEL